MMTNHERIMTLQRTLGVKMFPLTLFIGIASLDYEAMKTEKENCPGYFKLENQEFIDLEEFSNSPQAYNFLNKLWDKGVMTSYMVDRAKEQLQEFNAANFGCLKGEVLNAIVHSVMLPSKGNDKQIPHRANHHNDKYKAIINSDIFQNMNKDKRIVLIYLMNKSNLHTWQTPHIRCVTIAGDLNMSLTKVKSIINSLYDDRAISIGTTSSKGRVYIICENLFLTEPHEKNVENENIANSIQDNVSESDTSVLDDIDNIILAIEKSQIYLAHKEDRVRPYAGELENTVCKMWNFIIDFMKYHKTNVISGLSQLNIADRIGTNQCYVGAIINYFSIIGCIKKEIDPDTEKQKRYIVNPDIMFWKTVMPNHLPINSSDIIHFKKEKVEMPKTIEEQKDFALSRHAFQYLLT